MDTNPKRAPSLSCVKIFKPDFWIDFSAVGVIGVSFVEDGKKIKLKRPV